jgi:hypothetical protein
MRGIMNKMERHDFNYKKQLEGKDSERRNRETALDVDGLKPIVLPLGSADHLKRLPQERARHC